MLAIDTSSLIAYLSGDTGPDVEMVDFAFESESAVIPPVVLSEMLSDHKLSPEVIGLLKQLPLLALSRGFWERAGLSRAIVLKKGLKARLADTLIAQSCIDSDVALVTRDSDYRHFKRYCNLRLAT